MDAIFGKYLIRTTVVSSGFMGENWTGHWEVFDPALAEEGNLVERGIGIEQASFEKAGNIAHGEAVLSIRRSHGEEQINTYSDYR